MNKKPIFLVLTHFLVAVTAVVLTVAVVFFSNGTLMGSNKLQQLENLILNNYVDGADQKELEDAAAQAMIETLGDRWSYYMTAEEYEAQMEQNNNAYVGIGVTISGQDTENGMLIIAVAEGGPAEKAGLLPGDLIIAADGQSIVGKTTGEVQGLIKGKEGTTVQITYLRNGVESTVAVTRAMVKTPVAKAKMLPGNIGLVTIVNFNANCAKETKAAVQKLLDEGAQKLIFDVRNNPGGRVTELVSVLDYLLPEGALFRSKDNKGRESVENSDAACLEMPMAVLVNGNSYSAAEFFAAALQEYEWATVVGEKTVGKGNYQVTYKLQDGSAVGLSIGKYYTPQGKHLEGVGIMPDVVVPVDDKTAAAIYAGTLDPEEDPQIQSAIKALTE
ncbi:MAG: S41 family peptidase [Oscillospiraceae bacterium]|nr:S41 family peptidase [Oscillospiraceae bacterium]MBQ9843759.1 S41 family peptidase [Oscillospiraceae bacterium]